MVEQLVRADPPDYDRLERLSIDYTISMRSATRLYSVLLFLMPIALLFIWVFFIENLVLLVVSLAVYIVIVFMSIYSRFRVEKRYRDLQSSLLYYMTHSDSSMYNIRIAALVLAVLMFILLETYGSINQVDFFIVINVFILLSLVLSVFSPRFWHYGKGASQEINPEVSSKIDGIAHTDGMPRFTLHIIPEKRMKVANAYCVGMIRNRVFVTDYLVENLNNDEIVSIVAHELGHVRYRHNLKTLIMTFSLLFLSAALFFSYLYVSSALLSAMMAEAGIFLFILGVPALVPAVRRSFEIQADLFAAQFLDEETAVNALLKTNYLNLTPLQLSGGATHPPLVVRINRIKGSFRRRERRPGF